MRHLLFLLAFCTATAYSQEQVTLLRSRLATTSDRGKIEACLEIGKAYAKNQPDLAVFYCNQGMKLAEKLNDRRSLALLLLQLGRVNSLHRHAELARKFDNEALAIFRRLHDGEGTAEAYNELGLLDGQQQNISSATQNLDLAMKFYQDSHDSAGILTTYSGFGKVYEEKGDIEKALTYYLLVLVQYEHRLQKPEAYFILLEHIGELYLKKGDHKAALQYLEEGISNSNNPSLRDTKINLLDEEGKVYEDNNDKEQALSYYKQELAEAKKFNRLEEQAKALINIAGILKKENSSQSLSDLKEALRIAESLHEPQLEALIYKAFAGIYQQEKHYKEAMEALEEHHHLLDSLLVADTDRDVAVLDSSLVLGNSREQISGLQQETKQEKNELHVGVVILAAILVISVLLWFYLRKFRRLNRELKISNDIKDTLFSIIGHDLKGPAGGAALMFDMIEKEDFTDAELRHMIPEMGKQAKASFELLNALFEWGKAQMQGVQSKPENIATEPLIRKNINLLGQQAKQKKITVTDHTRIDTVVFADPHHVDFVIRNLISNAIKFSYDGGRIDIDAHKEKDEIIFSVKDTGIGISTERQQAFLKTNLSVSFGTKGEKGSGLGLMLIKEFMDVNKGRMWLESKEGEGSTFYFSFPEENLE